MDIAHGVQNDGRRNGFFPFHREKGKEVHKALEDTERSVARSSCNHGYILWGNRSLECLVAPKLIPSCAIWEADGRVLSSSHFVTNMTEIRTCHGKVYPAYLSEIALQMQGQRFADGEDTPCIIGLLFIPSLPYVSFTMKGKGSERCRFSFGKMRHCFIGTASLHSHHKVDDASTLVCAVIMPQVLPKVHFQAGIVVFSVRCVIKSIAVVPFGRFNTTGVQVVAYRYLFDML